ENAYLRQVTGYWDMAATLLLHGAIHEELFMDNAGEMIFVYAKFFPFLKELREKTGQPNFLKNMEAVIQRNPEAQERVRNMQERFKRMQQMHAAAQSSR